MILQVFRQILKLMINTISSLKNHFLIAMPQMQDPNFAGTLTYICDHTEQGAMGIIVNRPVDITLGEILSQLGLGDESCQEMVFAGGPVQTERGFVLHQEAGKWQSTLEVVPDIYMTTSKDVLAALADAQGPQNHLVALGYAGWGAGQLETELVENCWLTCPATTEILFHTPWHKRLEAAASTLGISLGQLSDQVGHG